MYYEKQPDGLNELDELEQKMKKFSELSYEVKNIEDIKWYLGLRKEELEELKQKMTHESTNFDDSQKLDQQIIEVESDIERMQSEIEMLEKIKSGMDVAHKN